MGMDEVKNITDANMVINGKYPLNYAADYGQVEVLKFLVSKNADVNKGDKYGITPLLNAIGEGHEDAVRYLLSVGADKSGKAPSGKSYKEHAKDLGQDAIANL